MRIDFKCSVEYKCIPTEVTLTICTDSSLKFCCVLKWVLGRNIFYFLFSII